MEFTLIYQNFDGLDISFQGAMPHAILDQLEEAKREAQQAKNNVYRELGEKKIRVMVAETGGSGGYAYRFDTGVAGEIWFVSNSSKSDNWNIRVSVKSLCLALNGYAGAKKKIIELLKDLEATGPATRDLETQEVINFPKERVSRFDYCFDFWTPDDFHPKPECFVAHARSNRSFIGKETGQEFHMGAHGKIIESVRIGAIPNRQVALYNKSQEIISHAKSYWKDIWKDSLSSFLKEIDIGTGTVWRVEARAGKDELDKWNLRTFADFENMAGDVVVSILKAIRYVRPNKDTNSSRWPIEKFWQDSIESSIEHLDQFISDATRKKIMVDYRENVAKGYRDRTIGNFIGLCAVNGISLDDLPCAIEELQKDLIGQFRHDPDLFYDKYQKITERYLYIDE